MWFEPEAQFDVWAVLGGLVGLAVLAVAAVFVWRIVRTFWQTVYNMTQPVRTELAEVVERREERPSRLLPAPRESEAHIGPRVHYVLTFELPDGRRIEFPVSRYDWRENDIGARGYLTFQGTWYKGFTRMDGPRLLED